MTAALLRRANWNKGATLSNEFSLRVPTKMDPILTEQELCAHGIYISPREFMSNKIVVEYGHLMWRLSNINISALLDAEHESMVI